MYIHTEDLIKPKLLVLTHVDPAKWTKARIGQLLVSVDKSHDDLIQIEEFVAWVFGTRSSAYSCCLWQVGAGPANRLLS